MKSGITGLKIGIAGFGVIGSAVGRALDIGVENLVLAGVCARTPEKARAGMAGYRRPAPLFSPEELARAADIIVECASPAAFMDIAVPAVRAGKILVTVSGAALLAHPEIVTMARKSGGRIILASGALPGLDAVRAAAEGIIHSVEIITRKPPGSLVGAPYIREQGIDLSALKDPLRIFSGSAREGAEKFPSNVNVAAALGLAGVGPDRTRLEIWADPSRIRNTHTIRVEADSARFDMTIENIPTPENPGTGKITALSVIAALRGLVTPLRIGT